MQTKSFYCSLLVFIETYNQCNTNRRKVNKNISIKKEIILLYENEKKNIKKTNLLAFIDW